jgi:transposase
VGRQVKFEPDSVVVEVALKRRRLLCPLREHSTASRKDKRPVDSVWRHLDLGIWRLEIHCRRRRLWCPQHGARTEGVPFARPGSEFTRDFECLVAWLATRTDKTTIKRMLRVDWDTVGRIVKRVCDDELDPARLDGLFDIGIDEVSWKRQHNYLTLVADHLRGKIVWGTDGAGEKAADRFLEELDPEIAALPPLAADPGSEQREPTVGERARKLRAISLDMGHGYAASARKHAPQAVICIDPYHVVQLANRALDEVRRAYWNELRRSDEQQAASASRTPAGACSRSPRGSPTNRPRRSRGSGLPAARCGAPTNSRKPSVASSDPDCRSRTSRC